MANAFTVLPNTDAYRRSPYSTTAGPIALVSMPWGSVKKPSLALPLLKSHLKMSGFTADVFLLNIRFARRVGLPQYERLSDISLHPEWFFSQAIFRSAEKEGVIARLEEMKASLAGRRFLEMLLAPLDNSEEACLSVATQVPAFLDECMAQVDWSRYMVVGFTTTFAQSFASVALSSRIKQRYPEVKIIFGGANVDSEMGVEWMRTFDCIDYVAHGESEVSFPQLLRNIAARDLQQKVPGISMRYQGEIIRGDGDERAFVDLNQSPVPDYSDYIDQLKEARFETTGGYSLFVESSRGCWWGAKHHCTFCGLNGTGMAYRKKDPLRVYSELMELSRKHHCLSFSATDNILPLEYYSQLLPNLAAADTDIRLFYEVKANQTHTQIKLLSDAGIKTIQPGIESFNSRLLTLMRKGVKAIQNIQLLKWCLESGIDPTYNILVGFPGEVPEDYADFPDLFRKLSHLRPPGGVYSVQFERFSPYHFEREKFGLTLRPLADYDFLFPDQVVSLEHLAYYFEGEWIGQKARPRDYTAPILAAWEEWKEHWARRNIVCYYFKGPNYVAIVDNRPTTRGAPAKGKRFFLDQPVATMYLYCDEHRSFQAIHEHVHRTLGDGWSEEKLRAFLDQLVVQELMYREDNRYLSLAIRKKSMEPTGQLPGRSMAKEA